MPSTHAALEQLCLALDQELERQELLHGLVKAQYEAIHARDHKVLEARTEAISVLARDSRDAEHTRHTLFDQLAIAYELPADGRNMSGLIGACPAPYHGRLKALQTDLRELVASTQQQARDNGRLVQRSLRAVRGTLEVAQPETQLAAGYPATHAGARKTAPVLLDQRG